MDIEGTGDSERNDRICIEALQVDEMNSMDEGEVA